jgi:hypothetical protein
MGYRLNSQNFISGRGKGFFSSFQHPDHWGSRSLIYNGNWGALSPGAKQLGHGADYSLPCKADVKNGGIVPLFPHTLSWRGA